MRAPAMSRVACVLGLAVAPLLACARAPAPHSAPAPASAPLSVAPDADAAHTPAPAAQRTRLRALIDSLVEQPRFHNAFWGVLIVDPARSDTLYALNAQKLFLPASNMKIVTAAVALAQLGPHYRFRTTFAAHGPIRHGILQGDLVVIGRGDPTVSDRMLPDPLASLRAIADSLVAHGVRRIAGHLIRAPDALTEPTLGYGWSWDDLTQPYAAGVDALFFNEGRAIVRVTGATRPGGPVTVRTAPLADYPTVRVHAITAAAAGGTALPPITSDYDAATGDIVIEGAIAPRDTATLEVAYRDPATAYLRALADALHAGGVVLGPARTPRPSRTRRAAPSPSLDTLFTVASPPLSDILPALLKPSQNQIAEILLRTIGREATGRASADSGRRVIETQLAAWGADPTEYVVRDGSGLSRYDYLAPATIVTTLEAIERDSAFDVFYRALPIAGVDGTLATRMRDTPAAGNVHAKTGYADRVRSLSGYVTTANGVRLVFSVLCNNWTVPVHDVEVVQDSIAVHLASMTVGAP
jgi:D-alanyl-D-alanine carboxypeptidase/D-alanyl-D-alanine-endopeptidase (penicillin-binding protein 4)